MRALLCLCIMAGLLLMPCLSDAAELNAYGTTLLRYEDHTIGAFGKQRAGVGTQYIGLDLDKLGNGNLSISLYGWGRTDISGESGATGDANADFTYGYLKYRFPDTSSELTAGRFFLYGRGISSYIDGVSLRSDLSLQGTPGGIGLQLFSGTPVKTDHIRDNRGDFLSGGRVSYRFPNRFEVGVASLYERGLAANGTVGAIVDYRNVVVGDVWFSPYRSVDVTGHTSYNTVTRGIAENRYLISLRPIDRLFATLEYNNSTFKDLFSSSSQRYLFNPNSNDRVTTYGGTATYSISPILDLSADYRYSLRSGRADTSRFGGGVVLKLAENRVRSGLSYHRYDVGGATAATDGFRVVSFNEARGFVMYDNAVYTASIDTIADVYDRSVHGKVVGYELAGSLGYRLRPNLKLSCDLSMADSPQFSNEIKAIARLVFSQVIAERPHLDYRSRHASDSSASTAVRQEKPKEQPETAVKPVAPAEAEAIPVPAAAEKTVEKPAVLPVAEPAPVAAEKPAEPLPAVDRPAVVKAAQGQTPAAPPVATAYRIDVQDMLSRRKADQVVANLKSAGCANIKLQPVERDLPMNRLFVAELQSASQAKKELKKLRNIAAGAFLLKSGGRYQLYAGSFRESKNAAAEQKRLAASGVNTTLREGLRIPARFYNVTADIPDRSVGEGLVNQLKKRGMDAELKSPGSPEPSAESDSAAPGGQNPDSLQINWLINELKRRGVDTSAIILDDESESGIDPDIHGSVILTAGMTDDKVSKVADPLSEVIR